MPFCSLYNLSHWLGKTSALPAQWVEPRKDIVTQGIFKAVVAYFYPWPALS